MKKQLLKRLCMIFMLLLFCNLVFAADFEIEKSVTPSEINYDEEFTVSISLTNNKDYSVTATVIEQLGAYDNLDNEEYIVSFDWDIDVTFDNVKDIFFEGMISPPSPYFEWEVEIEAYQTETITYTATPATLGEIYLGSSDVYVEDIEYESNSISITVLCNNNDVCEPDTEYENYENCNDCPSGSDDGLCDLVDDGIHDPDCTDNTDAAIREDHCENGMADFGVEDGVDCGGECEKECMICGDGNCVKGEHDCELDCGLFYQSINNWLDGIYWLQEFFAAFGLE